MGASVISKIHGQNTDLDETRSKFSYSSSRDRLLVAISLAQAGAFEQTQAALIDVLKSLEETHREGHFPQQAD